MYTRTFSECLRELISTHQWTLDYLASVTDYKSKTSISRILREQSSHKNRLAFFSRLCASGALSDAERELLSQALQVSAIGKDAVCARKILHRFIFDAPGRASAISPEMERMFKLFESARSAQIVLLNSLEDSLLRRLSETLAKSPNCTLRHYFRFGEGNAEAVELMEYLSRMSRYPNFSAYARDQKSPQSGSDLNALFARVERLGGETFDLTAIFTAPDDVSTLEIPSNHGMFEFFTRAAAVQRGAYRSVTLACSIDEGAFSFVNIMKYFEECERNRDMYHIMADMCVNIIPTRYLRASLEPRRLAAVFPDADADSLNRILATVLHYQHLRYKNMYEGNHLKHIIASTSAMLRFAQTGYITAHFVGMRPFNPQERAAILRDLLEQARSNRHFFFHFFKQGYEPKYEINCWDGLGITAVPLHGINLLTNNYGSSIVNHPRLVDTFKSMFLDELRKNCTLPQEECFAYLQSLIQRLEAGEFSIDS